MSRLYPHSPSVPAHVVWLQPECAYRADANVEVRARPCVRGYKGGQEPRGLDGPTRGPLFLASVRNALFCKPIK